MTIYTKSFIRKIWFLLISRKLDANMLSKISSFPKSDVSAGSSRWLFRAPIRGLSEQTQNRNCTSVITWDWLDFRPHGRKLFREGNFIVIKYFENELEMLRLSRYSKVQITMHFWNTPGFRDFRYWVAWSSSKIIVPLTFISHWFLGEEFLREACSTSYFIKGDFFYSALEFRQTKQINLDDNRRKHLRRTSHQNIR